MEDGLRKKLPEITLSMMEAEYVSFSTACKDLILVLGVIRELSTSLGLGDYFLADLHFAVHNDNVGALTLAKLEPSQMSLWSKHYAINYN